MSKFKVGDRVIVRKPEDVNETSTWSIWMDRFAEKDGMFLIKEII